MLLFYTDHITPRLQWTLDVFLNKIVGVHFELTDNKEKFLSSNENTLCYSKEPIGTATHIISHSLLFENTIHAQQISVLVDRHFSFFETSDDFLQFDFLAASFYLLSRYEEYLPHEKDTHGRFCFRNSLAHKYGFVDQPLVDQWAELVQNKLKSVFPKIRFKQKEFSILPTMDIDVAYAYRGRSMARNMRSLAKDIVTGDKERLSERKRVKDGAKDPFDNYEEYDILLEKHGLKGLYFFLLGDYGPYDKNLHFKNKDLIQLIKRYHKNAGSHLSYSSHESLEKMKVEKNRLENIVDRSIFRNRFHYLKFSLPKSYQKLVSLGYTEDYSMAYPEKPGFRAGTCTPYPYYDLENERGTDLIIYPTIVMDASCQDYLKLNPDQAFETISTLIDNTKKVNGLFIILWHNESLSDIGKWKGWKNILAKSLEYASSK